jgi:hypothetical protein
MFIWLSSAAGAQGGPSFSISTDILPYQDFDDTVMVVDGSDTTYYGDAQARIQKLKAQLTYPLVFAQGKTVIVNEFTYQYLEFKYKNFFDYPLKTLQSGSYTLMLQQKLSPKWSVWALGTPSLASDLKDEISEDDFNFQAAVIFIRHFSERFSLGVGAAFTTQFGEGKVLPVLAFDWNNGSNLSARAIIPTSLEFRYRPHQRVILGLVVSGDGNDFHGDPRVYLVDEPRLRYTMLTVAPSAKIYLTRRVSLNFEGGIIALHRFEFYDGDEETASYDLKPNYFVRLGLQLGG